MRNSNKDLLLIAAGAVLTVVGLLLINQSAILAGVFVVVGGVLVMSARVMQLVDYFRSRKGRQLK